MELEVYNAQGKTTGNKVSLSDEVFAIEPSQQAIYEAVRNFRANQRQGTHSTKTRAEVSFSTKKLYRQKGTGNARVGSARSGTRRGGGAIHGPKPRDYGYKLNRKVLQLARRSALSIKAASDSLRVIDSFGIDTPKTKDFLNVLNNLSIADQKVLVLTAEHNATVMKSGRNLPKVTILKGNEASTYDIMNTDVILAEAAAVEALNELLKS